jgi:hypothetical protein
MTATTTRPALICCFATLLIADQSKTHDISGNLLGLGHITVDTFGNV